MTQDILQRYVDGQLSSFELRAYLASAQYDDALSEEERDELAALDLVVLEVAENMRDNEEILPIVMRLIGAVNASRSNASTEWQQTTSTGSISQSSVSQTQRARISA